MTQATQKSTFHLIATPLGIGLIDFTGSGVFALAPDCAFVWTQLVGRCLEITDARSGEGAGALLHGLLNCRFPLGDYRPEATFRWCCEPPVCAHNDLVYPVVFADRVCFFCFQILAMSFSDLCLRTKTQKAEL